MNDPSMAGTRCDDVPPLDQVQSSHGNIGPAPVMYLSPFDAWLDATLASRAGMRYTVCAARDYDPREAILTHGGRLLVSLHCAWAACDGRLLTSHMSLTGLRHVQVLDIPRDRLSAIDLAVDRGALDTIERLHEHAGLFAFRDTYRMVSIWSPKEWQQALSTALRRLPGRAPAGSRINQAALYDPEASAWHFVPVGLFLNGEDRSGNGD
ncbi:hypothetical protein MW7_006790 [Imbroritus primus]|uniref:Uncharacterized protein n=1 Tax=Imbroritus primus TaxID=3058603 RepID=A0ACD3SQ68_9BURK|nr:hypothetical protein MW7_006790 [Burkholderiaceae bacterium PBA]